VGIAVLVICFVDKNSTRNIQEKLGNGLTPAPFAVIVVSTIRICCTFLSPLDYSKLSEAASFIII
jgi:hypothetical protein